MTGPDPNLSVTFVKKHWSFCRAIGAYGPVETPVFLYKSYGSVPLFWRVRTKFLCRVNGLVNVPLLPVSASPSSHYRKCLDCFQRIFDRHGALPDSLSCKDIYGLLFELACAAPLCAGFWEGVVDRPINRWAAMWRKSRFKLIENERK